MLASVARTCGRYRDAWFASIPARCAPPAPACSGAPPQAWPSLDAFIAEFRAPLKVHWDAAKAAEWMAANLVAEEGGRPVYGPRVHLPRVAPGRPRRPASPRAGVDDQTSPSPTITHSTSSRRLLTSDAIWRKRP